MCMEGVKWKDISQLTSLKPTLTVIIWPLGGSAASCKHNTDIPQKKLEGAKNAPLGDNSPLFCHYEPCILQIILYSIVNMKILISAALINSSTLKYN